MTDTMQVPPVTKDLRRKCLELAVATSKPGERSDEIILRAKAFEAYINEEANPNG